MKQSHIVTSHKQSSRKQGGIVTSYGPGNTIWSSIIHDVNVAVLLSGIVKHQHGNETHSSIVTSYGTSYTTQSGLVTHEKDSTMQSDAVT